MSKVIRLLNDGDTHGYLDGDRLIRTQNGLSAKRDNTHAVIGQNGKIESIFKKDDVKIIIIDDVIPESSPEDKAKKELDKLGVEYHPRTGLKKLLKLLNESKEK